MRPHRRPAHPILCPPAHALQHARTILWDKETNVYEIFKYAQFGAPSSNAFGR